MTTLSEFTLSSDSSRKVTQPGSSNGLHSGHDIAVSGKNLPGRASKNDNHDLKPGKKLDQALQNATDYAKKSGRRLSFSIEEKFNRTIVTVIDQQTGKVIRQIPMEEMVALAKLLSDVQVPGEDTVLKGLFFDQDT